MEVDRIEGDIMSYCIQNLMKDAEYMFRIFAENPVGKSEPLISETVLVRSPYDVPGPPEGPFAVTNMTESSFTLRWSPPTKDGGQTITEYIVERRQVDKKAWQRVGTTDGSTTVIQCTKLKKNTAYYFRVAAVNKMGTGAFYSPEDPISIGKQFTPPGPPSNLNVVDVTIRSVTLNWSTPINTGGAEITDYIIHRRLSSRSSWEKVETLSSSVTVFTVENLVQKSQYYFRVSAENSIGVGEPAETQKVSLKANATPPSPPTGPIEMRTSGPNSIFVEWGCPESDGGAPLLGYDVAVREAKKTMWMQVGHLTVEHQKINIKDLLEGHDYYIRVFARNEVGRSNPLDSEDPFRVVCPAGYEESADAEDHDRDTPSISYSTTSTSWMRDAGVDADITSYAKCRLINRDEYFFRIWYFSKDLFV